MLSKWLSGTKSPNCLTLNELILMTIHSEHKITRFRVTHGAISMVISSFCMLYKLKKVLINLWFYGKILVPVKP